MSETDLLPRQIFHPATKLLRASTRLLPDQISSSWTGAALVSS
ncbi:hypothetical protein TIFTF001_043222 [Ficus carica]|uniref:Uncharacterized protein n=1 Tax=Ficus carica TaxID=3494 RepID=A0AA88CXB7_FICCA|nr:hypothetical protein TIFTF001_043222 [Ficus carica]